MNDPYGFPSHPNQFPPPPGSGAPYATPQAPNASGVFAPGQQYDPAHFPPPPPTAPPQQGTPAYNNAYAYGANQDPNAPRQRGPGDENVSVAPRAQASATAPAFDNPSSNSYDQHQSVPDGMSGSPHITTC